MNGSVAENEGYNVNNREEEVIHDFNGESPLSQDEEHPNKRLCLRYIEMYNNHVISYSKEKKVSNFDDQILLDSAIAHKFGRLKPSIITEKGHVYVRTKNISQKTKRSLANSGAEPGLSDLGNEDDDGLCSDEDEEEFLDASTGLETNTEKQNDINREPDFDNSAQLHEKYQIEGSHWSSLEKEIFFNSLARHSIHNLDAIKANLPMKSEKDILIYYKMLKEALNSDDKRVKRALKSIYKLIPISFEMSEDYINIEEQFANLVSDMELDKKERINSQLYIKDRKIKVKDDNSLLKYASLYDLTQSIYWNQNVLKENDGNASSDCLKRLPPISERAVYKLFENLIYRYTVDLVEQLILLKGKDGKKIKDKKHQKKRLVLEINQEDVQKVLLSKAAVTKNTAGKNYGALYPAERTVYFQDIVDRLKLKSRKERSHIEDQMAEFRGLFDQFEFQKHFVDCLDTACNNNSTFFGYLESLNRSSAKCELEENKSGGDEAQEDEAQEDEAQEDKVQEREFSEEPHETDKIMKETEKLEKRDMQISRRYQLMMLRFLNTSS